MIIDCFTFCDELDLLELRLHTLADVVDQFVLVEATRTFQGNPKPLHFMEHHDEPRFTPFRNCFVHVMVDDPPMNATAWGREHFQRNEIRWALEEYDPDAIILVSDVDEIPNPDAVAALAQRDVFAGRDSVAFRQTLYSYTLNWRHVRDWYGTRAIRYRDLREPQALRQTQGPRYPGEPIIEDGGWSFSSFGGVSAIQKKLQSFSHTNCNRPEYLDPDHIKECIEHGVSVVPGDGNEYVWQDVDDSYPPYLLANLDRFQHWLSDAAMVKGWAY